jgi:Asp-tRNA(Asn)/Glu-tRNA(Gln) amidotransferase C subunit
MPLSKEQIEHIARLARLDPTPNEIEKFTPDSDGEYLLVPGVIG